MITQCCRCNRIRLLGRWWPWRYKYSKPIPLWGWTIHVSHGLCPRCAEIVLKEVEKMEVDK